MSTKKFLTKKLSKIEITFALFGTLILAAVWCATIRYFGLIIICGEPTSTFYSNWVSTVFLSVLHESKDNVKLFSIDSLKIFCVCASGITIGTYK